jgi:hypothetical protein
MHPQQQIHSMQNSRNSLVENANYLTQRERDYLYFAMGVMKSIMAKECITNWKEYMELEADEADEWVSYDIAVEASIEEILEMNAQLVDATFQRNAMNRRRSVSVMFRMLQIII